MKEMRNNKKRMAGEKKEKIKESCGESAEQLSNSMRWEIMLKSLL